MASVWVEITRRSPNQWITRLGFDDGSAAALGAPSIDLEDCLRTIEAVAEALRDDRRIIRGGGGPGAFGFTLCDAHGAPVAALVAASIAEAECRLLALRRWANDPKGFGVTIHGETAAATGARPWAMCVQARPRTDFAEVAATLPRDAELRSQRARDTIRRHALLAAGLGLVPVPWFDVIALSAVQVAMLRDLAEIHGANISSERARTAIAALVGGPLSHALARVAARGLWRLTPGLGPLIAALGAPSLGAAVTYAIGRVFAAHFESGGTLLSLDVPRMRARFQEELHAARSAQGRTPA